MKRNRYIIFVLALLILIIPFSSALELHQPSILDFDGDTLVGRKDPNGDRFYYHPDHLGSTDLVTNQSGDVVEETLYEPYGEIMSGGLSRFLYTGKELDDQTGLYYYGAR